jgi:hypothetical protein
MAFGAVVRHLEKGGASEWAEMLQHMLHLVNDCHYLMHYPRRAYASLFSNLVGTVLPDRIRPYEVPNEPPQGYREPGQSELRDVIAV